MKYEQIKARKNNRTFLKQYPNHLLTFWKEHELKDGQ